MSLRFSQAPALNDPFEFAVSIDPGKLRAFAQGLARRMLSPPAMAWLGVRALFRALREHERFRECNPIGRTLIGVLMAPFAAAIAMGSTPFLRRIGEPLVTTVADEIEEQIGPLSRAGMFLIFSCSETWESVPMWAHYAASHSGFAIGLDPSTAFRDPQPKRQGGFLRPQQVAYVDRTPKFDGKGQNFLIAKMDHWAYEKEWRFLSSPEGLTTAGRDDQGHEIYLAALAPGAIREIVFGATCSIETAQLVARALASNGSDPAFYQIELTSGYGFQRRFLNNIEAFRDPRPAHHPAVGDVFDQFPKSFSAYLEMQRQLAQHPLLGDRPPKAGQ